MRSPTEPDGYQKTILSDLQGAWQVFRESVVQTAGFENWDRVLLHTDEAMGWETVRNLDRMPALVLIIRNLCLQSGLSGEIMQNLEEIDEARRSGYPAASVLNVRYVNAMDVKTKKQLQAVGNIGRADMWLRIREMESKAHQYHFGFGLDEPPTLCNQFPNSHHSRNDLFRKVMNERVIESL